MADLMTDSSNDPFAVLGQDNSATRKQIAQYSIAQAAVYMQNDQYDQAITTFKKALAFDSSNVTAYNYLGKIYLSQGKNAESIKAYQQLVRIQSNPNLADSTTNAPTQVDAHISLGNAYLQDKQYTLSEKEFKTAANLDPQKPLAPYTLGLQYSNTDRLSEAEIQFQKVQRISPKDGNVYYALGMVYNKQGRYEEAAANLEKALSLKSDFTAANYELGVAYDALGRTEDANGQLSILKSSSDTTNTTNLANLLNKPGINYMDSKNGGFSTNLGPGVPLWMLDPTLLMKPGAGKTFSVKIGFNTGMDYASVTNTENWSISRADGGNGGYYNYSSSSTTASNSNPVELPSKPEAVYYNSTTQEAILIFRINQNSTIDIANGNQGATIDTSHVVFKFTGKDATGRTMDTSANQIDGNSVTAY